MNSYILESIEQNYQFSITPRTKSQPIIHLSTKNIKSKVQTRWHFRVRPKPISRLYMIEHFPKMRAPACGSRVHMTRVRRTSFGPWMMERFTWAPKWIGSSHPSVIHGLWCFWPFWTGRVFWQNDDPQPSRSSRFRMLCVLITVCAWAGF